MSAEGPGEVLRIPKVQHSQEPMEEDVPPPVVEQLLEGANAPPVADAPPPAALEDVNNVTFQNRYYQLQEKELDTGTLTVDEYIELFLVEVVQNLDCARQTLARGKQQFPKESMFISVQGFLCFNYADDFTGTLKKIKAVRKRLSKFERYVAEIEKRIFAYGIASIVNCYSTIKISTLANMIDFSSENDIINLVNMFKWTAENHVARISNTPQVQEFVSGQFSPEFGSFNGIEKFKTFANLGRHKEHPIDNLKKLMMVSDTLLKISLPPASAKNGSEEVSEDKPPSFAMA